MQKGGLAFKTGRHGDVNTLTSRWQMTTIPHRLAFYTLSVPAYTHARTQPWRTENGNHINVDKNCVIAFFTITNHTNLLKITRILGKIMWLHFLILMNHTNLLKITQILGKIVWLHFFTITNHINLDENHTNLEKNRVIAFEYKKNLTSMTYVWERYWDTLWMGLPYR